MLNFEYSKKIPLNLLFGDRNDDKVVPKTTKIRCTLKTTAVPESYWGHQVSPEKDSCYMSLYWFGKKNRIPIVANCKPQLESIIPIQTNQGIFIAQMVFLTRNAYFPNFPNGSE